MVELALMGDCIEDFLRKSSGFPEFKIRVDHGSNVNFGADSGFYLS